MTRREKIILAATGALAVGALVYQLLGSGPATRPAPAGQPAPQVVAQARDSAQALARQAEPGSVETALIGAIEKPWREAALYDQSLENRGAAKSAATPRFTGYVELGSGRLAVIDGYEYQVGDTLEGGGYKVLFVSPNKVTLESLANGQRLDVPYDGQDALGR
jgi:hypothetical protein